MAAVVISTEEKDVFFLEGNPAEEESVGKPALDGSTGLQLTPEACFEKFDLVWFEGGWSMSPAMTKHWQDGCYPVVERQTAGQEQEVSFRHY